MTSIIDKQAFLQTLSKKVDSLVETTAKHRAEQAEKYKSVLTALVYKELSDPNPAHVTTTVVDGQKQYRLTIWFNERAMGPCVLSHDELSFTIRAILSDLLPASSWTVEVHNDVFKFVIQW